MAEAPEGIACRSSLAWPIARRFASIVITLAVWQALLLGAAGTMGWPRA